MSFIVEIMLLALDIYTWIIIASAVISWLIAFEVLNVRNPQTANLVRLLDKATEPMYRPLRKYIEDEPSRPQHLLTVRGVGYKFIRGHSPKPAD